MHRGPDEAEGRIPSGADRLVERRPEARPAGTAVELRARREEIEIAAGAGEVAAPLLMQELAGEGTLSCALPQHGELLGAQKLAPFGVGMRDLESAIGVLGARRHPPERGGEGGQPQSARRQEKPPRHHDEVSQRIQPEAGEAPWRSSPWLWKIRAKAANCYGRRHHMRVIPARLRLVTVQHGRACRASDVSPYTVR